MDDFICHNYSTLMEWPPHILMHEWSGDPELWLGGIQSSAPRFRTMPCLMVCFPCHVKEGEETSLMLATRHHHLRHNAHSGTGTLTLRVVIHVAFLSCRSWVQCNAYALLWVNECVSLSTNSSVHFLFFLFVLFIHPPFSLSFLLIHLLVICPFVFSIPNLQVSFCWDTPCLVRSLTYYFTTRVI